jgi:hypothetical protein
MLNFQQVVQRLLGRAVALAGLSTDAPQTEIAVLDVSEFAPKVAARKQKAATGTTFARRSFRLLKIPLMLSRSPMSPLALRIPPPLRAIARCPT